MKGKINSIAPNGSFTTQHGEFFSFLYVIDGVNYQMNHKTDIAPFSEGDELEFEITQQATQQYPAKIKKSNPEFGNGQGFPTPAKKSAGGNRSFALSYAKDLAVSGHVTTEKMFQLAEKMVKWLDNPLPLEVNNTAPVPPPPVKQEEAEPDDLPF